MTKNYHVPQAKEDLQMIFNMLKNNVNFVFVRFSDGETEILRNRFSKITTDEVVYKGRSWKSIFPIYDQKEFNPQLHQLLRKDLMAAALTNDELYFKGFPTTHNKAQLDKNFYLRLNGGFDRRVTFSDLFMNDNHLMFIEHLRHHLISNNVTNLIVIANFRSILTGFLSGSGLIQIPDNFFSTYEEVKNNIIDELYKLEEHSIVLSSASSLSNVIGHFIITNKLPITFIDVGTSLHTFLSLDNSSRKYSNQSKHKRITW